MRSALCAGAMWQPHDPHGKPLCSAKETGDPEVCSHPLIMCCAEHTAHLCIAYYHTTIILIGSGLWLCP